MGRVVKSCAVVGECVREQECCHVLQGRAGLGEKPCSRLLEEEEGSLDRVAV